MIEPVYKFLFDRKVTFESYDHNNRLDRPDPQLFRIHAAYARIMDMSGAAEYIENIYREADDIDCALTLDDLSSSVFDELLLIRGLVEPIGGHRLLVTPRPTAGPV